MTFPDWLQLCLIPLITALVGWFTNYLAIKFLFRPRKPLDVGLCTFHGLIPRRQGQIAEQLAETIEKEFISSTHVAEYIEKIDIEPYLDEFASRVVREKMISKIQQIPLLGNFINDTSIGPIEAMVKEELMKEAKPLLAKIATDLEESLDVRGKVEEQLRAYSAEDLEEMISRIARKELRSIEWMGALLGLIAGIIQLAILWLMGYLQYS